MSSWFISLGPSQVTLCLPSFASWGRSCESPIGNTCYDLSMPFMTKWLPGHHAEERGNGLIFIPLNVFLLFTVWLIADSSAEEMRFFTVDSIDICISTQLAA